MYTIIRCDSESDGTICYDPVLQNFLQCISGIWSKVYIDRQVRGSFVLLFILSRFLSHFELSIHWKLISTNYYWISNCYVVNPVLYAYVQKLPLNKYLRRKKHSWNKTLGPNTDARRPTWHCHLTTHHRIGGPKIRDLLHKIRNLLCKVRYPPQAFITMVWRWMEIARIRVLLQQFE